MEEYIGDEDEEFEFDDDDEDDYVPGKYRFPEGPELLKDVFDKLTLEYGPETKPNQDSLLCAALKDLHEVMIRFGVDNFMKPGDAPIANDMADMRRDVAAVLNAEVIERVLSERFRYNPPTDEIVDGKRVTVWEQRRPVYIEDLE